MLASHISSFQYSMSERNCRTSRAAPENGHNTFLTFCAVSGLSTDSKSVVERSVQVQN